MLSPTSDVDSAYFEALRAREFARLDAADVAYLDYTGSALYAASQLQAHVRLLADGVYGNPHSEHAPSQASSALIAAARAATLEHFGVDEDTHAVCFVANASAAIKLVAESFPFAPQRGLVLSADNHNSMHGVREYARRAGAPVTVLPLDAALRLDAAAARFAAAAGAPGGLLAYPAQSNFSGVKHPLELIDAAHERGWSVLLDAAAFVPTNPLDLRVHTCDFVALSFYKMFGLPTGVGALVARRDALAQLRRPWFAGGTVQYASVQHARHRLHAGAEGFEDGTPNFLGLGAIEAGFDFLRRIGHARLGARVRALTTTFLDGLARLRHADGTPVARVYGPGAGATVAFNVLRRDGSVVPYAAVEARGRAAGVALRGGCFCNPGAAEAAFGFEAAATARCFDTLRDDFSIPRFAACLGAGRAVGALRASFGAATTQRDVARALELVASTAAEAPLRRAAAG